MDVKAVGTRLRAYREHAGLEQKQLAELSGVHQTTISRLERGLVERPTVVDLEALCAALDVHWSQIVGDSHSDELDRLNDLPHLTVSLRRWLRAGPPGDGVDFVAAILEREAEREELYRQANGEHDRQKAAQ